MKMLKVLLPMLLLMSIAVFAAGTLEQPFSLRVNNDGLKVNLWSNGDKGQGILHIREGSVLTRAKLSFVEVLDNGKLVYHAKVTKIDFSTRSVEQYERDVRVTLKNGKVSISHFGINNEPAKVYLR